MAVFIGTMYAIFFFSHRQEEAGRHIAHHRLAVARTASESSSSSSVSHGKSRLGPAVVPLPVVAPLRGFGRRGTLQCKVKDGPLYYNAAGACGTRIDKCNPSSFSFSCTSVSVVSPKFLTSSNWSSVS